jgi:hypothetical protein
MSFPERLSGAFSIPAYLLADASNDHGAYAHRLPSVIATFTLSTRSASTMWPI